MMETHKFDDMTLEQYEKYWYDIEAELFGSAKAKEYQQADRTHYLIMKQLWMEKGFHKYKQYREWEETHKEERNEYFRRKGSNYYDRKV